MGGEEDEIVTDGEICNNVNASLSSVVDENLRVRGISGLRICNASVFPDSISAPTALTCAALGYVAASEIWTTRRKVHREELVLDSPLFKKVEP